MDRESSQTPCSIWTEYVLELPQSELTVLISNPKVRHIVEKKSCCIEVTRRVLNRRYSSLHWIKYSIIRVSGPNSKAIHECNRLLERLVPIYQKRKAYPKRAPITYYSSSKSLLNAGGDLVYNPFRSSLSDVRSIDFDSQSSYRSKPSRSLSLSSMPSSSSSATKLWTGKKPRNDINSISKYSSSLWEMERKNESRNTKPCKKSTLHTSSQHLNQLLLKENSKLEISTEYVINLSDAIQDNKVQSSSFLQSSKISSNKQDHLKQKYTSTVSVNKPTKLPTQELKHPIEMDFSLQVPCTKPTQAISRSPLLNNTHKSNKVKKTTSTLQYTTNTLKSQPSSLLIGCSVDVAYPFSIDYEIKTLTEVNCNPVGVNLKDFTFFSLVTLGKRINNQLPGVVTLQQDSTLCESSVLENTISTIINTCLKRNDTTRTLGVPVESGGGTSNLACDNSKVMNTFTDGIRNWHIKLQRNTRFGVVVQIPVTVIQFEPSSTDAACFSIHGTNDVVTAALHIIAGDDIGLDVVSVHAGGNGAFIRYALTMLGYGFHADLLRNDDKLRWMGPHRYDYSGKRQIDLSVLYIYTSKPLCLLL
ncbi:unnamed protein product [Trichobilharzia regenti]|nr:unnamed protein product [Trichobilharzia regenti]